MSISIRRKKRDTTDIYRKVDGRKKERREASLPQQREATILHGNEDGEEKEDEEKGKKGSLDSEGRGKCHM